MGNYFLVALSQQLGKKESLYMDSGIVELLDDILSEAASIQEFTVDHTFETYSDDKRTRFALFFCFSQSGCYGCAVFVGDCAGSFFSLILAGLSLKSAVILYS